MEKQEEKEVLGMLHYHEAIDRCDSVARIISDMLLEHHVLANSKHKEWAAKVLLAQEIIAGVGQEIGSCPEYDEQ